MNFFIDIDQFLSKKQLSLYQVVLWIIFLFFAILAILLALSDGNYFSIISILVVGIICMSFSSEIKKLKAKNALVSFQRNIITGGFDTSFFAFFIFSDTQKCIFINRVAQNLFSGFKVRSMDDFLNCFSRYPDVVEAINSLRKTVGGFKQSHIDVPMSLNAESSTLWRIAVSPIPDHRGYSAWSIIDLTPSANKLESPETNSHFLLDILNHSDCGYVCVNGNEDIVFCNNAFSYFIGSDKYKIVGKPFEKYILRKENTDTIFDLNKDEFSTTTKICLKSEAEPRVEVLIKRIAHDENNFKIFSLTRNAQQHQELVQELGKTKLYFEHIFEDAPVGIVITDGVELISASNTTFCSLINQEDVANTSFLDYICDEERETIREKLYQFIGDIHRSIPPFEIKFKSQASKVVMLYVSKLDEFRRTKDNDGLVMYFIDVTKQKELQNQFVQSQKMQAVGQLAGGIAHDFNNLLTAMIGYCDLLLDKYSPSEQSFNDVMQIKQNANRASNLVRQLLAFSRQQTLQPKVLSITDMLSELTALLKRLLGAKIELKVVHAKNAGYIKVDQIQFEQVIINLAVNARDAMQNGGRLTITTQIHTQSEPKLLRDETMPAGKYVLIEVSDTGTGIDQANLHRIFDPFFSTKEKGRGTGLGLSTVYGIVNQTGGFISVQSELNVGTTFSLYFPLVSDDEVASSQAQIAAADMKHKDLTGVGTILLVEDEDAVRMFSSRALRDKGYRIIEASNGEMALEFLKKDASTIDLIISDVVMPKMDGPTLLSHIKQVNPNIKFIFISGYTEDAFRESLANDSSVHFLPKPFNLKELASKVKSVLG